MERERILIDTSVLIDHLRKSKKESTILYKLSRSSVFFISSVTEFEFRVGSTLHNGEFIEKLLSKIHVLPFDSICVKTASQIDQDLKAKNQLISLADIFIAATALAHNLQILTLNTKHFKRIQYQAIYSVQLIK